MAKLYFKYGVMGSSKTAQALMTRFNYLEKGFRVWLIKPGVADRDDKGDMCLITSRIGLSAEAYAVKESENVRESFDAWKREQEGLLKWTAVICDECQFLSEEQVNQLRTIADDCDVPVLCFGLRTDFQTHLFSGSRRLMEIADSISECKSVCSCGNKAIVNARFENGHLSCQGDVVSTKAKYRSMCYRCFQKEREKVKEGEFGMHRYKVNLVTGSDVERFVHISEQLPFEVKIENETGEKFGNAKTLLNVLDAVSWDSVYVVSEADVYDAYAEFIG